MLRNAFRTPATYEEYKNGMGRRALNSYLKYGYIPLEDSVPEAFHPLSRTATDSVREKLPSVGST